jgi:formyltetrahydrofolate synthetase
VILLDSADARGNLEHQRSSLRHRRYQAQASVSHKPRGFTERIFAEREVRRVQQVQAVLRSSNGDIEQSPLLIDVAAHQLTVEGQRSLRNIKHEHVIPIRDLRSVNNHQHDYRHCGAEVFFTVLRAVCRQLG